MRRREGPVRLQRPRQGLPVLLEGRLEVPLHQPEPVPIGLNLVRRIDRRDRVFQIADGRQGAFQHHVRQPRRIRRADRARPVDDQFDVNAVVDQKHALRPRRLAQIAHELRRILQRRNQRPVHDREAGDVRIGTAGQRRRLIQERLGPRHDTRAPRRIIGPLGRQIAQRIRAVEGVIQTAPPRIGRVQQEPRIQDRHHQLRSRQRRQLGVHIPGRDGEGGRLLNQIADLAQETSRRHGVVRLSAPCAIPVVDLGLKVVAFGQQGPVLRRKPAEHIRHAGPEAARFDAQPRQHLGFDEACEFRCDAQSGAVEIVGHEASPSRRSDRGCNIP